MSTTALCSTIHSGVLPFLEPFLASVAGQSDTDFELCLALDDVTVDQVRAALPAGLTARFICPPAGLSPAAVRTALFDEVCATHELAVLADADDVLEPTRVAAAVVAAGDADASACALSLIDAAGADMGLIFAAPSERSPAAIDELLARGNVFGLSNSCYRTRTLASCLPLPADCVAVDWYLVTVARLRGARLALDPARHMRYRQHDANIAPVVPPFTAAAIKRATAIVEQHYTLVGELERTGGTGNGEGAAGRGRADDDGLVGSDRPVSSGEPPTAGDPLRSALAVAREAFAVFAAAIADEAVLERYLEAVNQLPPPQAWWTMVAHPVLEALWRT